MKSQHIAAPKASRLALVVSGSFFLSVAIFVLASLADMLVTPLFARGHLPEGWSWGAATAVLTLSLLVLALFGGSLYQRVNTKLEPEGLLVPTLRGSKFIRWSEVERVSGRGMQIKLHTASTVVTVNPLCYARPGEVVTFLLANVQLRVPGSSAA